MSPAPRIESIGPPPDQHSERIVSEMLRYMHEQRCKLHDRHAHGIIDVRTMGTPKGQRRTVANLRDKIGPLLLEIGLAPAKRGKFVLLTSEWVLWNPNTEDVVHSDEPAPKGDAWLAVMSTSYTGTNHIPKSTSGVALIITYHALTRLPQRAGVRTVADMIIAIRKLWRVTDSMMSRFAPESQDWLRPPQGFWFLALPVTDGPVAVLAPERTHHDVLVVKTILDRWMVVEDIIEPEIIAPAAATRLG